MRTELSVQTPGCPSAAGAALGCVSNNVPVFVSAQCIQFWCICADTDLVLSQLEKEEEGVTVKLLQHYAAGGLSWATRLQTGRPLLYNALQVFPGRMGGMATASDVVERFPLLADCS